MGVIERSAVIENAGVAPIGHAGVPGNGTSAVQHIVISGTPTGGTYALGFGGETTTDLAFDADAAAVQAALEALGSVGAGGFTVSGTGASGDPFVVTAGGTLAKQPLDLITLEDNSLTGGTAPDVTITEATAGVAIDLIGHPKGALVQDTTNGTLYLNTGTLAAPVWTVAGTQS